MTTTTLISEISQDLSQIKSNGRGAYMDAQTIMQRLFTILQYQPGTIKMLDRQVMNFNKIMSRSTRNSEFYYYKSYAYASVGNYFTVKFNLLADFEEEVLEIVLDTVTYNKDGVTLRCVFDALKMKIKFARASRNYMYYNTKFSFYNDFLSLQDMPLLSSEEEVRMEIQDFLFDYTNLQELFEENE